MSISGNGGKAEGQVRILLVKPHMSLLVTKRLQDFLSLEPLELEIVAGGVPREDEVAILDMSKEKEPMAAFEEMLGRMRPHIVGFTGYSNNAAVVKDLALRVKDKNPSTLVVVGGIHATIVPADYAAPGIDLIVRGEGGSAFREILKRFKEGRRLSFDAVALCPSDPDFSELASGPLPPFPEVSAIPLPRRDLVDRSRYFSIWTSSPTRKLKTMYPRIASIRTSYGCKFRCSFCVVHHVMGGKYLERDPEDVVREIEGLKEEHVYFVDDETFLNAERMRQVASMLMERGVRKKYVSWARADTIVRRPELFRLWKDAGLSVVYVGLEAMDDARLNSYKKRTSVETNRKAIALLREIGITLHASLMVDPAFSVEDFLSIERTIREISPAEISFTVFSPSPGTELWRENREKFICEDPYLFYDCMHTLLPTRLDLNTFYAYFARIYRTAWSANPMRINRIRVPLREMFRVIANGTKYIFALRSIHRDYKPQAR